MDGSIRLSAKERKVLLEEVRRGTELRIRLRAHILLLLNDGIPWNMFVAVLLTSTGTINRWRQRYLEGRLPRSSKQGLGDGVAGSGRSPW